MSIQAENRREAYHDALPKVSNRQALILSLLKANPSGMTAEEILQTFLETGIICYPDMNFVRPRLTELAQQGRIEAAGKIKSERSGKNVTLWKIK